MRRIYFLIPVLIFILIFSACAHSIAHSPILKDKDHSDVPETEAPENSLNRKESGAAGEKDIGLIDANKRFAWDLFKKINEEDSDKEIFMSPFSVSGMLMMAYNGAEGSTRDAMARAMHYEGLSIDDLNEGYKYLISRLNNLDEKVKIEIANSIWSRKGFEIKQNFIDINKSYLFSDVESLDFANPESANVINNWVSKKTNNLIPSIIDPPIADDVMMYLINAIYFNGEWTEAFKVKNTFETDFYSYDRKTDKVQMMQKNGNADLSESDEYRAASLTYGNGKAAMMVILPNKDINEFIKNFDHKKWDEIVENLRPVRNVNLQLPKFKIEYGIKELNNSLASLGMEVIFSERADFSGISENLFINRVLHKAVLDVNEEGTEAAAVTVGEVMETSYSEPIKFIANKPFLFVIYDTEDGNILFAGKKLFGDR